MIADLDLNPFDLWRVFDWALGKLHGAFNNVDFLRSIGSFGLAIVALTLILRTLLFPLFAWQLRTMKKTQADQAKIGPELAALRKKYKGQPQKLNQEMQALYRTHGINPAASVLGCVPVLIQTALIIPLYSAIRSASNSLHSDLGFLWTHNVTETLHDACCLVSKTGHTLHYEGWISGLLANPALLLIPLIAAGASFVQAKMMLVQPNPALGAQVAQQQAMAKNMAFLGPVMVLFFAANLPQGLVLYWATQSLYMVVQQFYLLVVKDYHSLGGKSVPHPAWVLTARRLLGQESGA